MAISIVFHKQFEDDTHVVYQYGADPESMTHRVAVDTRTLDVECLCGQGSVVGKAARIQRDTGEWPERGGVSS